jgi:nicotinamide-nucleotide amidase
MPTAEIIAIGTELLLGVTQDTNTSYLAQELNRLGIDLFRTSIVGDNVNRITQAIEEASKRAEIVITSGGLGPTVDDPTRQAVANAFQMPLVFHSELWELIKARFKRAGRIASENNQRQAFIPRDAQVIENKVGTAPAFYIETGNKMVISLPGVPAELKFLFQTALVPLLQEKFGLHQTIYSKIIHTSGLGESLVDQTIADLEDKVNPTVGLTAYPGIVDIRITAKAANDKQANNIIHPLIETIQERLHDHIFGFDDDKLVDIVQKAKGNLTDPVNLCLTSQSKMHKELLEKLSIFDQIFIITEFPNLDTNFLRKGGKNNAYIMGLDESDEEDSKTLYFHWFDHNLWSMEKRVFSSHPSLFEVWLSNSILDYLRRKFIYKENK